MTIKETFQAIGIAFVILAFIFGSATIAALVSAGNADSYIPEFTNCHTVEGHEMCK